jgi:hypothetical protein
LAEVVSDQAKVIFKKHKKVASPNLLAQVLELNKAQSLQSKANIEIVNLMKYKIPIVIYLFNL